MNVKRFDVGCIVGVTIALILCIAYSEEMELWTWGIIVLAGSVLVSIGNNIAERLLE